MSDREYQLACDILNVIEAAVLGVVILWGIEVIWMIWSSKRQD